MSRIYTAKSYFEEMLLGTNVNGLGFINESSHDYFQKSHQGFLGSSSYTQNTNFSNDVISVGLLASDQLEIGINSILLRSREYYEHIRKDICRKLSLPIPYVTILPKPIYRPYFLSPGNKIANTDLAINGSWGTLGGFMFPTGTTGKLQLISNSHVLANSGLSEKGAPIYYMGNSPQQIGSLDNYTAVQSGIVNYIDLAVAQLEGFQNNGLVAGKARAPQRGEHVYKVGAKTGLTKGVIRSVDYTSKVNFNGMNVVFGKQIQISTVPPHHYAFSQPGDSGSFIRASSDNAFLGLLFAGNGPLTFANHSAQVILQLRKWGYKL